MCQVIETRIAVDALDALIRCSGSPLEIAIASVDSNDPTGTAREVSGARASSS
jgi:hypothetical protein